MLHNGQVLENAGRVLVPGQVGLLNGWGVFSTIRVFDGVLFAFERHWARMSRDAQLLRVPFPADAGELERNLLRLVEANHASNSALRVVVVRNRGGLWESDGLDSDFDVIAFTTGVKDWGRTVRLGMIADARQAANRFAGTKMLSWSLNLVCYEEAQSKGYNEVVLLNERGEVSECTSANIFVSAGDEVFTPPLSSGCLPGITREILIQETHPDGLQVVEKTLYPSDLEAADEVFITSTTRGLLPVDFIEGLKVKTADHMRPKLQAAFERYVNAYVARRKSAEAAR